MGRANAACAEGHFAQSGRSDQLVTIPNLHACAALGAIGIGFKHQAGHLCLRPQFKIGPCKASGAQKGLRCVPAPTIALVDLKIANAFVVALVEIVGGRNARLLRRLGKSIQHVPAKSLLFNSPFAARLPALEYFEIVGGGWRRTLGTVKQAWLDAFGAVHIVGAFVMVFVRFEIRQALIPAPIVIACELCPLVVIAGLAAHVNHAVDAAATAQNFATRVAQAAAV